MLGKDNAEFITEITFIGVVCNTLRIQDIDRTSHVRALCRSWSYLPGKSSYMGQTTTHQYVQSDSEFPQRTINYLVDHLRGFLA
jgi:hypothetical protein